MAWGKVFLNIVLGCALTEVAVVAQTGIPVSVYQQAAAALQKGNPAEAEQILRSALRQHPSEARALGLLAVILDAQKRYGEAEGYYQRALKLVPRSASLLNNLGNHYLARGDIEKARAAYLRVVTIEPRHPNANLQLAQMSVARKEGRLALKYLDRLPPDEQNATAVQLLRAQALHLSGQQDAGVSILTQLEQQTQGDPKTAYSIGMTFADWKRFEEAERAFSRALQAAPSNPDILYNLGLAAMRNGRFDRAKQIFELVLKQRPEDVDCLKNLARTYAETGQQDQAIILLVQAERLAPDRLDILMFLAHMAEEMSFFGDAAVAYDKYLKLRPDEDVIRRERGFALARSAKINEGLKDLRWYVEKYPKDGRGWYELGVAETVQERDKALEFLSKAVALDPRLHAARFARAVLFSRAGKPAEAIEDLKIVLAGNPKDFHALDALGQAQLQLNRVEEAVESLRQAVELSPKEPRFLTHYGRALQRAGRREEAQVVFNRFKLLGPDESRRRPYGGLFEFLRLPPAEQRAQYMTNLRRSINSRPHDPSLQLRLGRAMLSEGKIDEALEAFRSVLRLTEDLNVLADCGKTLLTAEQYAAAQEFLNRVVAAQPDSADARLDLATAIFHTDGPEAGLAELDKTPPEQRQGDYFLLRAQMLDAQGKPEEAAQTLNRGFRAAPTRGDLYFQAALFLIKHKDYRQAGDLLKEAVRIFPDAPELLLTQAIAYELLQQPEESQRLLSDIQSRWPEWGLPYMINGIMLEIRFKSAQAKPLLETAITLGAHDATVYYYLASAIAHATPEDTESAQQAIEQAFKLNPEDAYVRALAGKIAYTRKDYTAALEHLTAALRLWPEMIEAHQTLSATYRALGEREKSAAELKEIVRIKQANPTADQAPPFPVGDLLFTVRPPARPPS